MFFFFFQPILSIFGEKIKNKFFFYPVGIVLDAQLVNLRHLLIDQLFLLIIRHGQLLQGLHKLLRFRFADVTVLGGAEQIHLLLLHIAPYQQQFLLSFQQLLLHLVQRLRLRRQFLILKAAN